MPSVGMEGGSTALEDRMAAPQKSIIVGSNKGHTPKESHQGLREAVGTPASAAAVLTSQELEAARMSTV